MTRQAPLSTLLRSALGLHIKANGLRATAREIEIDPPALLRFMNGLELRSGNIDAIVRFLEHQETKP